jgi:uncharacterized repeat protein (TIGR03847 family)
MSDIEITPEVFTADYTGEPGKRTFFLQARGDSGNFTYLIEKQQVAVLAEKLQELLVIIDRKDAVRSSSPQRDSSLSFQPLEPQARVGTIGLGYEESDDRIIVLVRHYEEGEEGEEEGEGDPAVEESEAEGVRFMLRREQVRAFVLHAVAVVAEGRPICQLCGLPMDPSGHACPASNGHRRGSVA